MKELKIVYLVLFILVFHILSTSYALTGFTLLIGYQFKQPFQVQRKPLQKAYNASQLSNSMNTSNFLKYLSTLFSHIFVYYLLLIV